MKAEWLKKEYLILPDFAQGDIILGGSSMGFDRGTPSSKKLVCGSTPKNMKLDYDEEEMGLGKRGSPFSSEQSSTPVGMRIVVSLPEEEMPSPGDSSAEEVCSLSQVQELISFFFFLPLFISS